MKAETQGISRWRAMAATAIVAVAAVVVGLPTLRGTFVGADDHKLVLNHVLVNHPSWPHAWQLLTIIHRDLYQPIPLLSFSLEFAVAGRLGLFDEGLDSGAWFFHATNILLHTINAVLVWFLIRSVVASGSRSAETPTSGRSSLGLLVPTVAAVVFAIHPLQMEVIAWINGRMMLLAIHFALASMLSLGRWLDSRRFGWFIATVLFALLSAMSKARVELPALFLLLTWARRQRVDARFWLVWTLSTLVTAAIALINRHATEEAGLFTSAATELHGSTIARSFLALAWYLRHFVWPTGLAASYPPPIHANWTNSSILISLGVVLPIIGLAVWSFFRNRKLAFGLCWFFFGIASTLPVILPRKLLAADRYMYLAIIGLAWLSAVALERLLYWAKQSDMRTIARSAIGVVASVIVFALIGTSWTVAGYYESFVNKAKRIVELYPEEAFVWERLAWGYYNTKDFAKATEIANEAIRRNGGAQVDSGAYQVIGLCLKEQGKLTEAIAAMQKAVAIEPRSYLAQYRLGLLLDESGQVGDGLPAYEAAVTSVPGFNPGWLRLAAVYRQLGKLDEARRAYSRAVENNPYEVPAILGLAELDIAQGTPEAFSAAEGRLRQLLEWMPENTVARTNLGLVLYSTGRIEQAFEAYREVLERDHGNQAAMLNLAQIYAAVGDNDAANGLFAELATTQVGTLEEALAIHDLFVAQGRLGELKRFWDTNAGMMVVIPEARALDQWARALAGDAVQRSVLAEVAVKRSNSPALVAATVVVELAEGRCAEAIAASDKLAAMSSIEAAAYRRRLLASLEVFDSRHPESLCTYYIVAVELLADGNREAAKAAADLFAQKCHGVACVSWMEQLREKVAVGSGTP